jgi:ankyrin repeat protein
MGNNKRKAPPSEATAGAAHKRNSLPASPAGSPRASVAAGGFADQFDQSKQQFTDRANAQTPGIKRELAEAQAAAAGAETKTIAAASQYQGQLGGGADAGGGRLRGAPGVHRLQGGPDCVSLAPRPGQLLTAANRGDATAVTRLLAAGADVDAANSAGETALWRASFFGHVAVVEALLRAGGECEQGVGQWGLAPEGFTPLIAAAQEGHVEVVARLLAAGADVDAASATGQTALWAASHHGRAAVVEALLRAGADVNKAMPDGTTPLSAAAWQGHVAVAAWLLVAGAAH